MALKSKEKNQNENWTEKWFFNNRLVSVLLNIALILLVLFLLSKVSFIFKPITGMLAVVAAPIITSAIFYYLLNPIIEFLEKRTGWNRTITVSLLFIVLASILVLLLVWLIPVIRDQLMNFFNNWPQYYQHWTSIVQKWLDYPELKPVKSLISEYSSDINNQMIEWGKSYIQNGFIGLGQAAKILTIIGVTIVTFPFILFYMMRDGDKLPQFIERHLPKRLRKSTVEMMDEINDQISGYIRGQILTGVAVSIMFAIGFAIIGLPYGMWIALIAGPLNLIPFVGSFFAMVPALIIGGMDSMHMLIAVIIVYAIEQILESRLVHPIILGDNLKIHPITILVILLAGGELFGLMGVAFGIPTYAIIKVIVSHIYYWWRENSSLFKEE